MFFSMEIMKNISTISTLGLIFQFLEFGLLIQTHLCDLFAMVIMGCTNFLAELMKCFAHHPPVRDNV